MKNKFIALFLVLALTLGLAGCAEETAQIHQDQAYSSPLEVAQYIHLYDQLPKNYLTKKEATGLGWQSHKGNLWEVTDQMSIGGDIFQNREGKLPSKDGRKWYECDVNYSGGFRGEERLVYSNDGLIFLTKDHYETFSEITFEEEKNK